MSKFYGVIGNRDYIKLHGERRPFWEFLDRQPDGWLTSLAYMREDFPKNAPMMWDCGAWSYRKKEEPRLGKYLVTPEWALEQYAHRAKQGDIIVAPDHMLIPGVDVEARRKFNQQSAKSFLLLSQDSGFVPMAVVHGMDLGERIDIACCYVDLGYKALSLGGLAARASQKSVVLNAVQHIRQAFPHVWLHVLGLSSPDYAVAWNTFGVQSFDGASHFKQAFTAGVFYTEQGGKLVKHKAARTERGNPDVVLESIEAPLCDCGVCSLLREEGIDTRTYGSNEHNMGRAAHNLNMLIRAQRSALNGVTVLVSCVGKKKNVPTPARELYCSDWFIKARAYAERKGTRWYILSAKHELLEPERVIEPYEKTLNTMTADERREWAAGVRKQIARTVPRGRVIVLAGKRYREHLIGELTRLGYNVEVPMAGLGIGQQLGWLNRQLIRQLPLFAEEAV